MSLKAAVWPSRERRSDSLDQILESEFDEVLISLPGPGAEKTDEATRDCRQNHRVPSVPIPPDITRHPTVVGKYSWGIKLQCASDDVSREREDYLKKAKYQDAQIQELKHLTERHELQRTQLRSPVATAHNTVESLRERLAAAQSTISRLEDDNTRLRKENEARPSVDMQIQKLQQSVSEHEKDNARLKHIHVKAINNCGPGIEPKTDGEFSARIAAIQKAVRAFFRDNFRSYALASPVAKDVNRLIFEPRLISLAEIDNINIGNILEIVFWAHHEHLLDHWFMPTLEGADNEVICRLEEEIISGGMSALPIRGSAAPHGTIINRARILTRDWRSDTLPDRKRAEYWRHYTACLLSRSQKSNEHFEARNLLYTHRLAEYIQKLLIGTTDLNLDSKEYLELHFIMKCIIQLWTDLRCQPEHYSLDNSIRPDDQFDSETMEDFKQFIDKPHRQGQVFVVTAVVAKGIVKKAYKRAEEITTRVSKAQVMLGFEEEL